MTERPGERRPHRPLFRAARWAGRSRAERRRRAADAAAGRDLVVTTDALVAGGHFFADDPPDSIARKALSVNLSDLAAKGAEPIGFILALALPTDWTEDWLEAFAAGLGHDAAADRCPLVGGDTVWTPGPLTLSITAIGAVEPGRFAARGAPAPATCSTSPAPSATPFSACACGSGRGRRSSMRTASSCLTVTFLAAAAARSGVRGRALRQRRYGHLRRLLLGDLTKMLKVSGVTVMVEMTRLPLLPAASAAIGADPSLFPVAASGGDDYELIVATPASSAAEFEAAAAEAGVAVTLIGEAVVGVSARFVDREGARSSSGAVRSATFEIRSQI